MALRLIPRSLRRSGFLVTVPGAKRQLCHPVHASVEASRPRGFVVRKKSAFVLCAICGHRLPRPTSVTIAKRPSWWARDARKNASDLPDVTSEMSCDTMARRANQWRQPKSCQVSKCFTASPSLPRDSVGRVDRRQPIGVGVLGLPRRSNIDDDLWKQPPSDRRCATATLPTRGRERKTPYLTTDSGPRPCRRRRW
jgi:hypothetical protein